MRYRSKKDRWIVVLLSGIFLYLFILGIVLLVFSLSWVGGLLLLFGIAEGAFIGSLLATTYYEITPATLVVRGGWLLHREIELNSIQQVFPTRDPRSVPAWSLDRLQVDYRQGGHALSVLISPEDKERFLQDLAEHAADLEVREGRVVRRR